MFCINGIMCNVTVSVKPGNSSSTRSMNSNVAATEPADPDLRTPPSRQRLLMWLSSVLVRIIGRTEAGHQDAIKTFSSGVKDSRSNRHCSEESRQTESEKIKDNLFGSDIFSESWFSWKDISNVHFLGTFLLRVSSWGLFFFFPRFFVLIFEFFAHSSGSV